MLVRDYHHVPAGVGEPVDDDETSLRAMDHQRVAVVGARGRDAEHALFPLARFSAVFSDIPVPPRRPKVVHVSPEVSARYLTNASCKPPSTGTTCPVTLDDRSDAR